MQQSVKIGSLVLCLLLITNLGFSQGNSFFFNMAFYNPVEDNINTGYGSGLGATFMLTRNIVVSLELKYERYSVDKVEGDFLNGSLYVTPIIGTVQYYFIPGAIFSPYIFGGIGLIFSNFNPKERKSFPEATIRRQDIKDGLGFQGGIGSTFLIMERLSVYMEGYFLYRNTDVETSLLTGGSETFGANISHLGILIGVRYNY